MTGQSTVFGESAIGVGCGVWGEDVVDDHRQDRHVVSAHGLGQCGVDRGVFQRCQRSVEHRLGECADEVAAAGGDSGSPSFVAHTGRPVSFIEWIQPG